jgi:hypothetical protein
VQRRWVVRPRPGELMVDRDEVVQALMDGEAHLHRSGGSLRVVTQRVRAEELFADGLPGEAHTQAVIVEWSDVNGHRASAEQTTPVQAPAVYAPEPEPLDPAQALAAQLAQVQAGQPAQPAPPPEPPAPPPRRRPLPDVPMTDDGLRVSAAEDDASVVAGLR